MNIRSVSGVQFLPPISSQILQKCSWSSFPCQGQHVTATQPPIYFISLQLQEKVLRTNIDTKDHTLLHTHTHTQPKDHSSITRSPRTALEHQAQFFCFRSEIRRWIKRMRRWLLPRFALLVQVFKQLKVSNVYSWFEPWAFSCADFICS